MATILSGPIGRALTSAEAANENYEWFKRYWPKTRPPEYTSVTLKEVFSERRFKTWKFRDDTELIYEV